MDRRQLFAAVALAGCGAARGATDLGPTDRMRDAVERNLTALARTLPPREAALLRRHTRTIATAHTEACFPRK